VLQVFPVCISIGVFIGGVASDVFGAAAVGAALSFTAFAVGLGVLVLSPRMRDLRLSRLGEAGAVVRAGH
jgi:hypothetical protein